MDDLNSRFLELAMEGFECSQILMILFLEMEGKENPDLIRAMGGLTGGMGRTGGCCGSLTGGAAVLGYFTARGESGEMEHEKSREIIAAYVNWFQETYGSLYGGCTCSDILQGDRSRAAQICGPLVRSCFDKILELLLEYKILEEP